MHRQTAVLTGGSSGLGAAIAACLQMDGWMVYNLSKTAPVADRTALEAKGIHWIQCDLRSAEDVAHVVDPLQKMPVHALINCAGINEIMWLQHLDIETWDHVIAVNARAIMLMAQAFLQTLTETRGAIVNIISNASHMPMTASLAYNASKGAAHIMTLQLARELTKKNGITVFGISPNKLRGTEMSTYIEERVLAVRGWTAEQATDYQCKALVTGMETDPWAVAKLLTYLLHSKDNHQYLSGCILPYGA